MLPTTALRRGALALLPLLLAGCDGGVLDPRGPIGAANRLILINALEIMLAIVIPTIGAALFFAWWFRASNTRARYLPNWSHSGRIELIVWSIPTLVILFLGGVIWIGSHELDPAQPIASQHKPIEVQVVSLDWKWLFIYPEEGVASVNQLVVPVGVPVHFSLTAASVMNAFFVPQLGSMIYTMNGMVTQLHLQADHPGDYLGESAQYSGSGFSDMRFTLRATTQADYAAWIAEAKRGNQKLDEAAYKNLLQQSSKVPPSTFSGIDPMLFHAVVTQQLPPGPGPQTGSGAPPTVHPKTEG